MWQRKKSKKAKKPPMRTLVEAFCKEEFNDDSKDLVNALVSVLHSHRFKKEEEFVQEIDFSIVRNVLYSYTTKARLRFMGDNVYSYLFRHFGEKGGREFIESKVHSKPNLYVCELETEYNQLGAESAAKI
jgi:hypothetical protein